MDGSGPIFILGAVNVKSDLPAANWQFQFAGQNVEKEMGLQTDFIGLLAC